MADSSHLDSKYFIDDHVYNCPFCKRGNVAYYVRSKVEFNWTTTKPCYIYTVWCNSCQNKSMHLSYENIYTSSTGTSGYSRFNIEDDEDLDSKFFYSVPTSFFALDARIPSILRELFVEAEGCLKSNYLTGASACVRKIVYELAVLEKATGENYDERIKSLKTIRTDIEEEYFDTLLTIQQVTSSKVHEESYDGWESRHLQLLLSTIGEVLTLMYVIPELRKEKRTAILALKEELTGPKSEETEEGA